jgi:hypothetical protein
MKMCTRWELEDEKTRKVMSLLVKADLLERADREMSLAMVRHQYGVNKNKQYLHPV